MPGPDPWLNRRDRDFVGLPPQERRIGQTAHEFVALAASAPRVILTRSKKENGSLARPSRLDLAHQGARGRGGQAGNAAARAALGSTGLAAQRTPGGGGACRPPAAPASARRAPAPLKRHRNRDLVRQPLRHLRAPHSRPRAAPPADETSDARDKGILYHAALHGFFQAYPHALPENAAAKLLRKLDKAAEELGFNLENAPFWRPRFARFAEWFAGSESRSAAPAFKC